MRGRGVDVSKTLFYFIRIIAGQGERSAESDQQKKGKRD